MSGDVIEVRAEPEVMKLGQVARRLQVSVDTVRREIRAKRLACVHVGSQIRVTEKQLAAYLEGDQ